MNKNNLTDLDYINLVLTLEKDMVKNYAVALTEASNEYLYDRYNSMFEKISKMQREVFELMNSKGFYNLKQVSKQEIIEKLNTLTSKNDEI